MASSKGWVAASAMVLAAWAAPVMAQGVNHPDQGKLTATGGVSQVEGAGGGGLAPWALITGYGTRDSFGGNAHATYLQTHDYALASQGAAVGVYDRIEVSFARQEFRGIDAALDGVKIKQDILGVKVRVAGDAVYGQDTWWPQLAVGVMAKRNKGIRGLEGLGVRRATDLGARKNEGTDYYLAVTKVYLAQSLLVNGVVRYTKANQLGLLGFGGDKGDKYRPEFEGSVAYLLTRKLALGAEYRSRPRNLGVDDEKDAWDVFVAWFPSKNLSFTVAYVDLGDIVKPFNPKRQRGPYLSVQAGF